MVKNPPAMWETWVLSLGWEDPQQKGKATHSSILAWRSPWTVLGVTKNRTRLSDFHFHVVKDPSAKASDRGLTPGLGRFPGGGDGHPLQYSGRGHSRNRGAWRTAVRGATESDVTG